jgi:hypothetical protein
MFVFKKRAKLTVTMHVGLYSARVVAHDRRFRSRASWTNIVEHLQPENFLKTYAKYPGGIRSHDPQTQCPRFGLKTYFLAAQFFPGFEAQCDFSLQNDVKGTWDRCYDF